MFEKLLTNKYFCVAIIVALIVVLFLYSQKKSCDVEGMQNVDLTPLGQELAEAPWTTDKGGRKHKSVGNKFDKYADLYNILKLKKHGYSYTDFLKRADDSYRTYVENENYSPLDEDHLTGKRRPPLDDIPRPIDTHPELSQCQPCICPQDRIRATDDDSDIDFSETEPESESIRRRKHYKRKRSHHKKHN